MAEKIRQFRQDVQIPHGTTAQTNLKLTDIIPVQHEDLATNVNQMKKISLGQCLCEPFAVCNSNNPADGKYVADCVNFPDFALSFTDSQGNSHNLVGLKVRVMFTYGVTYGSVSGVTFPELNINGSGSIPLLAQGKKMGAGAISAGQTVEFTIIPYGNSLAFDADSNVREANSDYSIMTDDLITYTANNIDNTRVGKIFNVWNTNKAVDIPKGVTIVTFNGAWYNQDVNNYLVALCRRGENDVVTVNILASNGYIHTVSGTVISVNSNEDAVQTNIVYLC